MGRHMTDEAVRRAVAMVGGSPVFVLSAMLMQTGVMVGSVSGPRRWGDRAERDSRLQQESQDARKRHDAMAPARTARER
jgi:hypothetical protein